MAALSSEVMKAPGAGEPGNTRAGRKSSFRADIEGLRAIAIGLVLVYHAAPQYASGGFIGVDVFFVISGFLITSLLLREVAQTGRISLRDFYSRRARRLLPAATVVLIFSAVVTWFILPVTQRRAFGGDIFTAAISLVNWRLADRSVDYLAEGVGASPVQHFWSLAVEEQFYVIWPILIVIVVLLARRFRWNVKTALVVASLALVAIPSFLWSVHFTAAEPQAAFFVTTTRRWELAIGALVALGAGLWTRLPRMLSHVIFFGGIAGIVAAAFILDSGTRWPGSAAMWPVLATAAVLLGGKKSASTVGGWLLTNRFMVWIGGLSYSLYLWHWPLLIGAEGLWGELRIREAVVITLFAIVPAYLSMRFIENPIRFSKHLKRTAGTGLRLGFALCTASAVAGVAILTSAAVSVPDKPATRANPPGAMILLSDPGLDPSAVDAAATLTPEPEFAVDDIPVTYEDGCQVAIADSEVRLCTYGAAYGTKTVFLVGDSKANQWHSALDAIAQRNNWTLVTAMKGSCAFADATSVVDHERFTTCDEWNRDVLYKIIEAQPDAVISSQGGARALEERSDIASSYTEEAMVAGLVTQWNRLRERDIPMIVIAANADPQEKLSRIECVAQNRESLSACAFPGRSPTADVQYAAAAEVEGVSVVDLNPYICPDGTCPAVIGDALVYRQGGHLTKTFVDSLTPVLAGALDPLVEEASEYPEP